MDNDNTKRPTNESEASEALDDNVVVRPITDEEAVSEGNKSAEEEQKDKQDKASESATTADGQSADGQPKQDVSKETAEAVETESDRHLKEAIAEQAREDERPHSSNFTLGKILGGDILTAQMFRSNIWLVILIVGFIVVYITNRYKVQKDLLEIDKLNTELEDAKYRALSSSSNLTEKSRESHVMESLQQGPDSTLKQSDQPPYIIEVPDK